MHILTTLKEIVWGPPLLMLLVGTGVYLTVLLNGLQIRRLPYALKLVFKRHASAGQGDISPFQALMTALSGTIGIGNIAGVATAITFGGVGAIVWMWAIGLVGMATKYAEVILAVRFRTTDAKGHIAGGPMYYLEHGLGWKWLAVLFCLFGALAAIGTGNMVQANTIASVAQGAFSFSPLVTGIVLAILLGLAILGGIRSIGRIASILVPFMALLYISGGVLIIIAHYHLLGAALGHMLQSAVCGQAAFGAFAGASVMQAIRMGVSRGVFASEAGLGTAPMAAAAAKTEYPGRQALVSMTGTFFDTIIVCTITGVVIALTEVLGLVGPDGELLTGAALTAAAFDTIFPFAGTLLVVVGVILFGYSTMLTWSYYGELCCAYLCGLRSTMYYRIIYILSVVLGATMSLQAVWDIADIFNGLMAIPNLLGILALSKVIVQETRRYELSGVPSRASLS